MINPFMEPQDQVTLSNPLPKRSTIGLLTANIHMGAGKILWPGVADAAEKLDINLFCFIGGILNHSNNYEYQRNIAYDLVDADRLDGLISWSSSIGGSMSSHEVIQFHQRYQPIPLLSLAQMEGYPVLALENYNGMRSAVIHLIEKHGFKRLAFLRGPEGHYLAQERYQAYREVLAEYEIPIDENLITPPLNWDAGTEAVRILLDERSLRPGVDFEGIVAVSDLLALDAARSLYARGYQIPRDAALVGFNDSREGRLFTPPLTSVALRFYDQGIRAVESLLARIEGKFIPQRTLLHSRMVVRQSCGCPSEQVTQAGWIDAEKQADRAQEILVAKMESAAQDWGKSSTWARQLIDVFLESMAAAPGQEGFLAALAGWLYQAAQEGNDLNPWQSVISILRQELLPQLDIQQHLRAENLFGQARVLISEVAQREQAQRQLQAERQAGMLREFGQAMIMTFYIEELANVLAERLPKMGIKSCFLSLFENPAAPLETSRLILAFTEKGRIPLAQKGVAFPSQKLVPEGMLPQDRRFSYIVEPLFFRDERIGFVLFEIGAREGSVYEVLRGHISSALEGALIFREAQEARIAAEKADWIKTRLLSNVSHELRTPLKIIIGHTKKTLQSPKPYGITPPAELVNDLRQIQTSAEHQLRVINDLLDLTRAEIDELDLYLEEVDVRALLEDAFRSMASYTVPENQVVWQLELPETLPSVRGDPVRLRQVILNLLSNASKFTDQGHITLGAEVSALNLHIWVEDTGEGIPAERQDLIFEPFSASESENNRRSGIGLGLSIARRLVGLHGGSMQVNSEEGKGSTFHIYLPAPIHSTVSETVTDVEQLSLLLISNSEQPPAEVAVFCQRLNLEIQRLAGYEDLETSLEGRKPAALAWDLSNANADNWSIVRRIRNHPYLCSVPILLYEQGQDHESTEGVGLTNFLLKSNDEQVFMDVVRASYQSGTKGTILVVDDNPQERSTHVAILQKAFAEHPIRMAEDGKSALEIMASEVPSLVVLDLLMPGLNGFDVLDQMREDARLKHVPVVILSSKLLTLDDVQRLERHKQVTFQSKGILSESEMVEAFNRALFGTDSLPPQTSTLARRAVAYLQQNYANPLSRWEIAEAIGVSEDYLTRVFNKELGLSPWDYLNRYRIHQAKKLLQNSSESIRSIARKVGYKDQSYFSRVFHKITGAAPNAYRLGPGQNA